MQSQTRKNCLHWYKSIDHTVANELLRLYYLKSANKQKIFVDKQPFLSRLAQHTLKLLVRTSLRDVRNLC